MTQKKEKKEYQVVISTRIPEILNRQVRAFCDRKGLKINAFIAAALKKHLKES